MSDPLPLEPPDWANATWEGSRRAQLRAALSMTVRERLLAVQELCELSDKLARMRRHNVQEPPPGTLDASGKR